MNAQRFLDAQAPVIAQALKELREGSKQSHWMWFVFPQMAGLGHSPMAQHFAMYSLAEAQAYLVHPVLGPRLRECTEAVLGVESRSAHEIFGSPDDLKFHSSMTLFHHAAPDDALFRTALDKYFAGEEDPLTLEKLH
ncbi:MAG TPA: DUF1810 domain-containing protein [Rhizomicrobium sp.]